MAASLFLPFIPLLSGRSFADHFLSGTPWTGWGSSSELVNRPRRWDIAFIGRFMVVFGLVSPVFDLLTFAFAWRSILVPRCFALRGSVGGTNLAVPLGNP